MNPLNHFIRGDTSSHKDEYSSIFDKLGISTDRTSRNAVQPSSKGAALGLMITNTLKSTPTTYSAPSKTISNLFRPVIPVKPAPVIPGVPRAPDVIGSQPKPVYIPPPRLPKLSTSVPIPAPPPRILPINDTGKSVPSPVASKVYSIFSTPPQKASGFNPLRL